MLVSVLVQTVYIAKFFWWETGYFCSMDIQHDRAGTYDPTESYKMPLYTTIYHYIPLYTTIYHYILLYTTIYHYVPPYTPVYTTIHYYTLLYTLYTRILYLLGMHVLGTVDVYNAHIFPHRAPNYVICAHNLVFFSRWNSLCLVQLRL